MSHVKTWWNIRLITPADNYCTKTVFFLYIYVCTLYSLYTLPSYVHDIEMQCTAMHHCRQCSGSSASEYLTPIKARYVLRRSCLFGL